MYSLLADDIAAALEAVLGHHLRLGHLGSRFEKLCLYLRLDLQQGLVLGRQLFVIVDIGGVQTLGLLLEATWIFEFLGLGLLHRVIDLVITVF